MKQTRTFQFTARGFASSLDEISRALQDAANTLPAGNRVVEIQTTPLDPIGVILTVTVRV